MQANASSPEGADALRSAIAQHDDALLEGGVDLDQVDEQDGEKIVNHVMGDNRTALAAQLNGATPEGFDLGGLVQKALPLLAPLVMSFLAKGGGQQSGGRRRDRPRRPARRTVLGRSGRPGRPAGGGRRTGGIDLGGLLGGLLGGGQQQGQGASQDRTRAAPIWAGWTWAGSWAASSARSSPVRQYRPHLRRR